MEPKELQMNDENLKAMIETENIINDKNRKHYNNIEEIEKEILTTDDIKAINEARKELANGETISHN